MPLRATEWAPIKWLAWVLLILPGCAVTHPDVRPTTGPKIAQAVLPELDAAKIVAMSRAWLLAFDRCDTRAAKSEMEPYFIKFEEARYYDKRDVLWHCDRPRAERAMRSRTWKADRVYWQNDASAVFLGESIEHLSGANGHASNVDAWDSLVWVPYRGSWKLAFWQWQQGGLAMERARWNSIYRTQRIPFSKKPNALLVWAVKNLKPGAALDVAMGQGRNALYLASRGWKVTGIDISDEGIREAKAAAAKRGLKLNAIEADINTWDFGSDKWDLINLSYVGDHRVVEKVKRALKKGGVVVIAFFGRTGPSSTGIGGFSKGELAKEFGSGFEILRDEVTPGIADWGEHKALIARFVARKK